MNNIGLYYCIFAHEIYIISNSLHIVRMKNVLFDLHLFCNVKY